MNDENDWSDSNDDDENNDAFHDDAKNFNQLAKTNHNPPQHDTGHIKMVKARPSDTCPHIFSIIIRNVNGLGAMNNSKLVKIVSLMIDQKINAYFLQETWQLGEYMTTIIGYTVFHRGMKEKTQQQRLMRAGVMIILCLELEQAWT